MITVNTVILCMCHDFWPLQWFCITAMIIMQNMYKIGIVDVHKMPQHCSFSLALCQYITWRKFTLIFLLFDKLFLFSSHLVWNCMCIAWLICILVSLLCNYSAAKQWLLSLKAIDNWLLNAVWFTEISQFLPKKIYRDYADFLLWFSCSPVDSWSTDSSAS